MKQVAIIGAGLTGLSAGIALQKQNITTIIYEKAPWAGGVCTAWTRKGYTFDGCIHWMVGTKPNEPMRKIYESVHALEQNTTIYHIDSLVVEINNIVYNIPLNLGKFQDYLTNISPEDSSLILKFCQEINKVIHTEMIPGKPRTLKGFIHAVTKGRNFLRVVIKFLHVTVGDYFKNVHSKELIQVIYHLMNPSLSMFALLMMLGTRMAHNGGFPEGGARDVIRRMEEHYLLLGGKIMYNTPITYLVVNQQMVSEIRSNNQSFPATHVIAACDMYYTLHQLLQHQYPHPVLDRMLKESPLFEPIMLISLGLNKKFGIPSSATFEINDPLNVGGNTRVGHYHIRSFDFDPSLAPLGHSSVIITLSAPFDYWYLLKETDKITYQKEKMAIAAKMISILESRYQGISAAVKVIDVATPSTYYRLNNLYKGSYEGFMPSPNVLKEKIETKIKGIQNLYLAGQWVTPGGGIPPAIISGIETANQIMKQK